MIAEFPRKGVVHGGVQAAVYALAPALAAHPDVEALQVIDPRYDVEREEREELDSNLDIRFLPAQRRYTLPTRSLLTFLRVKRAADEFRPSIVHGHGLGERGSIASRLQYASVNTIHGVGTTELQLRERNRFLFRAKQHLTERMVDATLRRLRGVIAISHFAREHYLYRFDGPIAIIPNAVRPLFYAEPPQATRDGYLLFVGVMGPVKNVTGMLRAFARVRNQQPAARMKLVGPFADDSYRNEIERTLREVGDEGVEFSGNLQGAELVSVMKRAQALVLFSLHENSPLAVAEALTLGVPVIASRVGGVPELIEDGVSGFLVQPNDEAALAANMLKVLTSNSVSPAMGQQARLRSTRLWSPAAVAEQTIQCYHRILS